LFLPPSEQSNAKAKPAAHLPSASDEANRSVLVNIYLRATCTGTCKLTITPDKPKASISKIQGGAGTNAKTMKK